MIATALIIASVILFISSICLCIYRIAKGRQNPTIAQKSGINTALIFSLSLLFSIWLLRFAVQYFAPQGETLSWWEQIFNGFFGALRTFSMEEEYAQYIINIKALIPKIVSEKSEYFTLIQTATIIYATVLNVAAPTIGGAIIFELLSKIFPRFKLALAYLCFKRTKYFFSELNPASLALAKSIIESKKSEKPILIFTDVYVDNEEEKEYELLLTAKLYGAICTRADLAHVKKPRFGKCEYYLMDENEFGNLQTLMRLVEDQNVKFVKNSMIYLFVQSDSYVQIEKQVNAKLDSEETKKILNGGEKPLIVPINGYRNLVHNLFLDVPLYEPLINKTDSKKLSVTIFGNGTIGTEAFLSAYWFGQLMVSKNENGKATMSECDLNINVVSKDTEDEFWSKIDYVNPEIKETVEVIGDKRTNASDKLLKWNNKGETNNRYCKVNYCKCDVKVGGFWNSGDKNSAQLLDSDYYIIALGNDADNISIAEKLRRSIGKKHLESISNVKNTVIAYAVFDPQLAKTLNKQKRYYIQKDKNDIYMHAFGSLDQVYSCKNVYMSKSSIWAAETGAIYNDAQIEQNYIADNNKRSKDGNDSNYNYWANIARASHVKYKVFSLGWINRSIFDYYGDTIKLSETNTENILPKETDQIQTKYKLASADSYHRDVVKKICEEYKRIAVSNFLCKDDEKGKTAKADLETKKHCLAWLEHRRWNAFTRTMGYRHTEVKNIFKVKGEQKDMELKVHSCLVEAKLPSCENNESYIYAKFKDDGKVDIKSALKDIENKELDLLDDVSLTRRKEEKKGISDDFKMYDYYRCEFDDYLTVEEASELLKEDAEILVDGCANGKYKGVLYFGETSQLFIPFKELKPEINKMYRPLDPENNSDLKLIKEYMNGKSHNVMELFGSFYEVKNIKSKASEKIPTPV